MKMNTIPKGYVRDDRDPKCGFKERAWALVAALLFLSHFTIAIAIAVRLNDAGMPALASAMCGATVGFGGVWVPWSVICQLGWWLAARRILRILEPGTSVEFTVRSSRRRRTRFGKVVRILPQSRCVEIEVLSSSGNRRNILRSIFDVELMTTDVDLVAETGSGKAPG